ncbi:MAG: hypothetical protein AAFX81_15655 [Pseudomonadota bacterium]
MLQPAKHFDFGRAEASVERPARILNAVTKPVVHAGVSKDLGRSNLPRDSAVRAKLKADVKGMDRAHPVHFLRGGRDTASVGYFDSAGPSS